MRDVVDRVAEILLVEDNPADARLAQEAFREGHSSTRVHVVDNCDGALQFLRGQGQFAGQHRPDLVLLDLNLNGSSGQELLAHIKGDPALRCIPVTILTTSQHEPDILAAYQSGANCYVTKPVELDEFIKLIHALDHFWFRVATLPPR